jgi:hypothetical protein
MIMGIIVVKSFADRNSGNIFQGSFLPDWTSVMRESSKVHAIRIGSDIPCQQGIFVESIDSGGHAAQIASRANLLATNSLLGRSREMFCGEQGIFRGEQGIRRLQGNSSPTPLSTGGSFAELCAYKNAPEGGCPGAQLVTMNFDDKAFPRRPQWTVWGNSHEFSTSACCALWSVGSVRSVFEDPRRQFED